MSIELNTPPEELKEKFLAIRSIDDFADLIEVRSAFLRYVVLHMPKEKKYHTFHIPKKRKNEFRTICEPIKPLKTIQRKLHQILMAVYEPRCSVHGFLPDRSVITNAKQHKEKRKLKFVLNVDIEDFFGTITLPRVRGLFKSVPYKLPTDVADFIARLCCNDDGLPQGAPTSPVVANMLCNSMDSALQRLAQKRRCTYTRYADDITFSTSMPRFPTTIAIREAGIVNLGRELESIFIEHNFQVNLQKLRLQEQTQRQEITGLTVNRFPNVRQKYIRQIRSILHDWAKNGRDVAEKKHFKHFSNKHRYPDKRDHTLLEIVLGKIEYLGMVRGKNDAMYRRFMLQLTELEPKVKFEDLAHMTENPVKIFISYASEDREIVQEIYHRLKKAGYVPWMDKISLHGGVDWKNEIDNEIKDSDIFLAMLSNTSTTKRGYVQKEFKYALDKWDEKLETDIYLIPVKLEECVVPNRLSDFHWVDYFAPNGWNKLTQSIQESIRRSAT